MAAMVSPGLAWPPRWRRAGRFVQHHVDGEVSDVRVGLGKRVGALEFGVAAVRIGEPEPQPGGGFGDESSNTVGDTILIRRQCGANRSVPNTVTS